IRPGRGVVDLDIEFPVGAPTPKLSRERAPYLDRSVGDGGVEGCRPDRPPAVVPDVRGDPQPLPQRLRPNPEPEPRRDLPCLEAQAGHGEPSRPCRALLRQPPP